MSRNPPGHNVQSMSAADRERTATALRKMQAEYLSAATDYNGHQTDCEACGNEVKLQSGLVVVLHCIEGMKLGQFLTMKRAVFEANKVSAAHFGVSI